MKRWRKAAQEIFATGNKNSISKRRQRNRLILIISAIVIVVAVSIFFIFRSNILASAPRQVTVTVAWNPGSITDDMVRIMAVASDTQISLQNITGANGAAGANSVFQSERNGTALLSTSLSALVTSEAMGFTENSHESWTAWLCVFSPTVVVVANDSPYHSMSDLITAIRQNPGKLRCADSGFGTTSFIAAELLSTRVVLELDHISYSGSNQAIEALQSNEENESDADFAVLLSIEIAEQLKAGQVRAIGAFTESDYTVQNGDKTITIPSITGIDGRLDAVLPFGEYFGLFIPSDTPGSRLSGLDKLIKDIVDSEAFIEFSHRKMLVTILPDREKSTEIMEHLSSTVCWTLYEVGYLPTNPETLGIPRP